MKLSREGGQSPGLSGLRYDQISPKEVGQQTAIISQAITDGTYRPYGTRSTRIEKPSGGTRTLQLGEIWDRVVAKALHHAVSPIFEKQFLDCSYGFRKARNAWQMLARLKQFMEDNDCWVLAIDDIREAFDHVPLARAVETHRVLLETTFDRCLSSCVILAPTRPTGEASKRFVLRWSIGNCGVGIGIGAARRRSLGS